LSQKNLKKKTFEYQRITDKVKIFKEKSYEYICGN